MESLTVNGRFVVPASELRIERLQDRAEIAAVIAKPCQAQMMTSTVRQRKQRIAFFTGPSGSIAMHRSVIDGGNRQLAIDERIQRLRWVTTCVVSVGLAGHVG